MRVAVLRRRMRLGLSFCLCLRVIKMVLWLVGCVALCCVFYADVRGRDGCAFSFSCGLYVIHNNVPVFVFVLFKRIPYFRTIWPIPMSFLMASPRTQQDGQLKKKICFFLIAGLLYTHTLCVQNTHPWCVEKKILMICISYNVLICTYLLTTYPSTLLLFWVRCTTETYIHTYMHI